MLIELRIGGGGKGAVSMFPPSKHADSGEVVAWDSDGDPLEIEGHKLKQKVDDLAVASLLVSHYPGEGSRHNAFLVLGGVLARARFNASQIERFVRVIAKAVGDDDIPNRIEAAVSALDRLDRNAETPGLPRFAEVWGQEVAKKVIKWFDLEPANRRRAAQDELKMVCVGDVDMTEVEWLWEGRLARGKVTIISGDPGFGKSQLATDMAAVISRGARWPDRGRAAKGSVILLSAEDDLSDTVRPRLEAAGADV